MYCIKCGHIIPDEGDFCPNCGEKVMKNEHMNKSQPEECQMKSTNVLDVSDESQNLRGKSCSILAVVIVLLVSALVVASAYNQSRICDMEYCDDLKTHGGEYCYYHTCRYDDCDSCVMAAEEYCYVHQLIYACTIEGCNNLKDYESSYCNEHNINMSILLKDSYFSFELNSAGGIVFDFSATNGTGKEIKYVRFKVELYNAVDDSIRDEISGNSYENVEIIGPIKPGEKVGVSNEIIGYCDNCAKIEIDEITVIYSDGTRQTGYYNYYYSE